MKKIILTLCIAFLIVWGGSLIKCEVNTFMYGNQFHDEYKQTNMISGTQKLKVLKYSENKAKIYYSNKEYGNIIIFEKKNNKWIMDTWDTVWSRTGSADGFIWPYVR